jgi:hypothetical protein
MAVDGARGQGDGRAGDGVDHDGERHYEDKSEGAEAGELVEPCAQGLAVAQRSDPGLAFG